MFLAGKCPLTGKTNLYWVVYICLWSSLLTLNGSFNVYIRIATMLLRFVFANELYVKVKENIMLLLLRISYAVTFEYNVPLFKLIQLSKHIIAL